MNAKKDIRQLAIDTIQTEAAAISALAGYVNADFENTVNLIHSSNGRVIVTGIGKSAIIANKIVATLNSTGTPSVFMHAADAIHGDLGIIQPDDVVVCLSKSGSTPEIKVLIPLIKNMGNKIVAIVSNTGSYLAQQSDYVLNAHVDAEACPNNLAPTSSTTAQLVIGDALAVCLLNLKGFSAEDFARVHPGGALGKKMYLRVSDIMGQEAPKVDADTNIQDVLIEISAKMLGAAVVLDNNGTVIGIVTDGDIRRMLQKNSNIEGITAKDIMTVNPKMIDYDEKAIKAFNLMDEYQITSIIVMKDGQYAGLVHIHDILREGIV